MKIMVVEDERDLADAIARGLMRQAYSVDVAYDGAKALESIEINRYDLLVLDINLPGIDGLEICRRVRSADSRIGILILTARASQDARVLGLDLGADDYLVKPFHFPELISRVRAILRREGEVRKVVLRIDDLVLDPNALSTYIGDQRLILTAKEFAILEYLISNTGRVVSQEELLEHVWNEEVNLFTQSDLPPENDTRYNIVKRGDKWSEKGIHQNKSSISSARLKYCLARETLLESSQRRLGSVTSLITAGEKNTAVCV